MCFGPHEPVLWNPVPHASSVSLLAANIDLVGLTNAFVGIASPFHPLSGPACHQLGYAAPWALITDLCPGGGLRECWEERRHVLSTNTMELGQGGERWGGWRRAGIFILMGKTGNTCRPVKAGDVLSQKSSRNPPRCPHAVFSGLQGFST